MNKQEVVKAYFHRLEKKNPEELLKLFTPTATVYSPAYMEQKTDAAHFYRELLTNYSPQKVEVKSIFADVISKDHFAAHYSITTMMQNRLFLQLEGVNLFQFPPDGDKIQHLTIIYVTLPTLPH